MPPIGRYPENLQITNQDFADARLNEILKDKDESSTYTFSNEFAERAKEANSFGRDAQSKVLWLFADACDYALQPSNPKNPFTPKWVFSDKRSILPEDFFEDEKFAEFLAYYSTGKNYLKENNLNNVKNTSAKNYYYVTDLNEGFIFPESAALSPCQDYSGHISDGFLN